ncbi:MAG: energy-coupling factor transporter transmembrane component T [Spirochaetota bacterium]
MVEINFFHYIPGTTSIHQADPRLKIVFLILISAVVFVSELEGLIILTCTVAFALFHIRVSAKILLKEMIPFYCLLILIMVSKGFTARGLLSGSMYCWRLVLVILYAFLFTATTLLTELRAAIIWFLKPFPFVPEGKIAMLVSVCISMVPLIFDQAQVISRAQKSRCSEKIINPAAKIRFFMVLLIINTFQRAGETALALEARVLTDHRSELKLKMGRKDLVVFLPSGIIIGIALFLSQT